MGIRRQRTPVSAEESDSARNGHAFCLLCGEWNPWSLKLRFEASDAGMVTTRFTGHFGLQGYDNTLHGGVIAALLDAAMTHCLFHQGVQGLTGDLHIRYLHPVPCDATLDVSAAVASSTPPLFCLTAEVCWAGRTMARADAKFMERADAR